MIGLLPNPWLILGAIAIWVSTYFYGHHAGWKERDLDMQSAVARKNEESRKREQDLTSRLNDQSVQLKEANNVLNQKQSALDRAIRAGRVRISTPASCVSTGPSAPAPSGDSAEAPSESERQTLAAIAAIVAEGDRAINQLNACIDAYNKVMESVNGQR
jgi:hypothetical protein